MRHTAAAAAAAVVVVVATHDIVTISIDIIAVDRY
jgi:hypothetical protein